jgi:hypothetical protein
MTLPTLTQVHVDAPLTNISIAYMQKNGTSPFGYVSDKIFPIVPVSKKSDLYYKYNKDDWFRGGMKLRAPATESAGTGFRLSTDSYVCQVYALHDDVADQDRANQDAVLDLDSDATEMLTQNMTIDREVDWANAYFKSGVWANDKAGGTDFAVWNDYVNSEPVEDVEQAKVAIEKTTGYSPNFMCVGRLVHARLKRHPIIRDQFKYTSADSITPAMLARIFEIDQYYVCGGVKSTKVEGDTSTTNAMDFIQGNHVLIGYAAPGASLRRPSAGYTFTWTGYQGAPYAAPQMTRIPMQHLKATRIEGEMGFVHKVVASDMAYFMGSAVSA